MSCSLGEACATADLMGRYFETGDEELGQQVRDEHVDRGAPAWLTQDE